MTHNWSDYKGCLLYCMNLTTECKRRGATYPVVSQGELSCDQRQDVSIYLPHCKFNLAAMNILTHHLSDDFSMYLEYPWFATAQDEIKALHWRVKRLFQI
jgi:hypothetical protein